MKIITALMNEQINEKLKKINKFEVIGKDFQYQEALIETINKNINVLILNSTLPGDLDLYELINVIKYKNPYINIFIILEKENEEIINFLIKKGINNIFFNNKITEDELIIEILKIDKKTNLPISINDTQKDKKTIIRKLKIKKFEEKEIMKKENIKSETITVIGPPKIGKSIFSILLCLSTENKKILLIDYNLKKNDIKTIVGKKEKNNLIKYNKNIDILSINKENININDYINNYELIVYDIGNIEESKTIILENKNIILLVEPNLLGIKETSYILELMINKWKINKKYIKIIFNKINMFSINIEILNQIFSNFKIVGKLESNEYYNYLINNNLKIIKNSIKDNYKKISKKIIK